MQHWRIVVAELAERGIRLHDPAVLASSWLDVRAVIFSLLDPPRGTEPPSRLRAALTRR